MPKKATVFSMKCSETGKAWISYLPLPIAEVSFLFLDLFFDAHPPCHNEMIEDAEEHQRKMLSIWHAEELCVCPFEEAEEQTKKWIKLTGSDLFGYNCPDDEVMRQYLLANRHRTRAIIYQGFHPPTGLSYIGKSINSIITRVSQHVAYARNFEGQHKFYSFFKDHYKEFRWSVLKRTNSIDVDDWEEHFIRLYDAVENGFCSEYGGNWGKEVSEDVQLLYIRDDEWKRKMSEAHKGKKLSDEHKRSISETLKAKQYHVIHSEETRKKIGMNQRARIPVYSPELNQCFASAHEAASYVGGAQGNICKALKTNGKMRVKGSRWFPAMKIGEQALPYHLAIPLLFI